MVPRSKFYICLILLTFSFAQQEGQLIHGPLFTILFPGMEQNWPTPAYENTRDISKNGLIEEKSTENSTHLVTVSEGVSGKFNNKFTEYQGIDNSGSAASEYNLEESHQKKGRMTEYFWKNDKTTNSYGTEGDPTVEDYMQRSESYYQYTKPREESDISPMIFEFWPFPPISEYMSFPPIGKFESPMDSNMESLWPFNGAEDTEYDPYWESFQNKESHTKEFTDSYPTYEEFKTDTMAKGISNKQIDEMQADKTPNTNKPGDEFKPTMEGDEITNKVENPSRDNEMSKRSEIYQSHPSTIRDSPDIDSVTTMRELTTTKYVKSFDEIQKEAKDRNLTMCYSCSGLHCPQLFTESNRMKRMSASNICLSKTCYLRIDLESLPVIPTYACSPFSSQQLGRCGAHAATNILAAASYGEYCCLGEMCNTLMEPAALELSYEELTSSSTAVKAINFSCKSAVVAVVIWLMINDF